ncbi:hypothetical protein V8C86DRAFT_3194781 [Haematococcus lacustris]
MAGLRLRCPVARLLLQSTAAPQTQRYGDGGLLALHLACRQPSSQLPGLPPPACHQEPQQQCCALSLGGAGAAAYVALVRSVLASKQQACGLGAAELQRLCVLVVEAFLLALPPAPPQAAGPGGVEALPLRLLVVPGLAARHWGGLPVGLQAASPEANRIRGRGVLLELPPSPASQRLLPLGPCLVALFTVSLTPPSAHGLTLTPHTAGADAPPHIRPRPASSSSSSRGAQAVEVAAGGQFLGAGLRLESVGAAGWSAAAVELQLLLELVDRLASLGVKLLATQQLMHEEVAAAALRQGMLPLQRLSARHAAQLVQLSGALPLTRLVLPAQAARVPGCRAGQGVGEGGAARLGPAAPCAGRGGEARRGEGGRLGSPGGGGGSEGGQGSGDEEGGGGLWRHLGLIGGCQLKELGHRSYLLLTPLPPTCPLPLPDQAWRGGAGSAAALQEAVGRAVPVSSLVVGACSDSAGDELQGAVEAALRVLGWAAKVVPLVLPGGGAAEALMAARLRQAARAGGSGAGQHWARATQVSRAKLRSVSDDIVDRIQVSAWDAMARALEDAAAALVPRGKPGVAGSALDGLLAVQSLAEHVEQQVQRAMQNWASPAQRSSATAAMHAPRLSFVGWSQTQGQFTQVATCTAAHQASTQRQHATDEMERAAAGAAMRPCSVGVELGGAVGDAVLLDSLPAKLAAVVAAADAAYMVLRIAGLVAEL